jgi:hypothetical protein
LLPQLRTSLSEAFTAWRNAICGALTRLCDDGLSSPDAALQAITTSMLSAIQGACCSPRPRAIREACA